jgi:BirA family biotin operon repressor/biotin-[acetyl-CoA-carboxylase] ligase
MTAEELQQKLTDLPVKKIYYFEEIGSTNDFALHLLSEDEGCEDGTLVIADAQTSGRGRFDRKWFTHPNSSLAFTLVMLPSAEEAQKNALFAPLGALAVSLSLEDLGLKPKIKWPNDVLLEECKTCGVLAESFWLGDQLKGIALGIGVNIGMDSIPKSENLLFPATCVEAHYHKPLERLDLLKDILKYIFRWRGELTNDSFIRALKNAWLLRETVMLQSRDNEEPIKAKC